MQNSVTRFLPVLLILILAISSCKKDTKDLISPLTSQQSDTPVSNSVSMELLKDSTLLFARDIYLWNEQIPTAFNARSYADPSAVMTGIRPYSMEAGFPQVVDKWSFAMKKTEWNDISGGMASSNSSNSEGDFVFSVFFKSEGDLRVRLVEPNSPSGRAGLHRGWKVISINGNSNMTTGNAAFIINKVYESTSGSFTFQKPDGSSQTVSLTAAHYQEKPVYLDTVYTIGDKKIGYLVFNSFLGNQQQVASDFQRVFNKFNNQRITDIVVDLRYNGGGYVSLAEKLGNYLVSSSANGGIMMTQKYNSQNAGNNEVTRFNKLGSLNVPDIYFIVGRGTASASELLINNLKPYMDVKLLGPTATHGKPVGFFPISVGDWYVFPVSFRTLNKNNEGNYFNGIPVSAQVADGLDKDWGDVGEASLASAIRNITTGSYRTGNQSLEDFYQEESPVKSGNDRLNQPGLKVTIDDMR